ncbi:MAG: hypothetical protein ABR925_02580 [Acidimicrobiales bacterium]|jgi:hypothetical protein
MATRRHDHAREAPERRRPEERAGLLAPGESATDLTSGTRG